MNEIKKELYQQCINYVQKRLDTITHAITAAQQAANEDTKSSAGDKYETGRAMMQQDTDRNRVQLNEANKLMATLNRISSNTKSETAEAGSLVMTNNGNFYLAISAGTLTVSGQSFFAVSPASPIGAKLKGQRSGAEFQLNDKSYRIQEVI
jgi:hypothetical protein